jgi:energy-converting hydrogenase Eha subunit A
VTQHLDDDAELYALGFTERERSEEIEAHLATCAACCARVAAAESVAASLAAALPPMPAAKPRRQSQTWWPQLATAAAVVFAATTALEGGLVHGESQRVQRTDVALTALASTHFAHTTLTSRPGLIVKTIYSRDGAWAYVVASGAPAGAHVVLRQGSAQRDLGALDDGTPATLFIQQPGRGDEYDIVANGNVIAHGKPQY